jgi:toxin ParE1/3/4
VAYKLSVKAEEDILRVYRESFLLFGAEQTDNYFAGLERVFEFLSDTPEAAKELVEIWPPVRIHPYRSHIIVYLIVGNGDVLILRVRHERENWMADPL